MTAMAQELPQYDNLGSKNDLVAVQESASVMREVLEQTVGKTEVTFVAQVDSLSEIYITPQLSKLLRDFLVHIEEGGDIAFLPNEKKYTVQEAAKILGMDESYLLKLLEQGNISMKVVDGVQYIESSSLHGYKRQRKSRGYAILDKMFELEKDFY